MLHLIQSNRFESLLEALHARLDAEQSGPFAAREVVVPSSAIRRRVELSRADRAGVCARLEFAYLGQWLWATMARVIPLPSLSPYSPERLEWRIHALLAGSAGFAAHPRLGPYLDRADPVMRHDLAARLARLLDQYITYRPDWLAAWSEGRGALPAGTVDEAWQAELWRALSAGAGHEHPSQAFFQALETGGDAARARLPASVHVFCLPALPPLYLDILARLGAWMEVRLYVLNPCEEYWFEIVDRGHLAHLRARGRADHHEVGNALLAEWGRQNRAQLEQLFAADGLFQDQDDLFLSPSDDTLLGDRKSVV
jgi:exodeoxyribonuclease V gamma subunit